MVIPTHEGLRTGGNSYVQNLRILFTKIVEKHRWKEKLKYIFEVKNFFKAFLWYLKRFTVANSSYRHIFLKTHEEEAALKQFFFWCAILMNNCLHDLNSTALKSVPFLHIWTFTFIRMELFKKALWNIFLVLSVNLSPFSVFMLGFWKNFVCLLLRQIWIKRNY